MQVGATVSQPGRPGDTVLGPQWYTSVAKSEAHGQGRQVRVLVGARATDSVLDGRAAAAKVTHDRTTAGPV
jgi:hypothetical protein